MATMRGVVGQQRVREKAAPAVTRVVNAEEVARMAYALYVQRGQADGHDLDDWLKAETILLKRSPRRVKRSGRKSN